MHYFARTQGKSSFTLFNYALLVDFLYSYTLFLPFRIFQWISSEFSKRNRWQVPIVGYTWCYAAFIFQSLIHGWTVARFFSFTRSSRSQSPILRLLIRLHPSSSQRKILTFFSFSRLSDRSSVFTLEWSAHNLPCPFSFWADISNMTLALHIYSAFVSHHSCSTHQPRLNQPPFNIP